MDIWWNTAAWVLNGFFMFVAVWRPDTFGGGLMARIVFTANFFGFIVNWTAFVSKGGLL